MTRRVVLRHSSFVSVISMSPRHVHRLDQSRLPLSRPGRPDGRHGRGGVCARCRRRGRCSIGRRPCWATICIKLCTEGPAAELDTTVHSQPALFVASLAALEQLKHDSPELVERCAAAAGLSLGEYTALVFAGVMDFEAGLRVVQERGRAMQDAADADVERHGQHPGHGTRASRIALRTGPRRRDAGNRQPALPRQHRRLRPQRRPANGSPNWPPRPGR